MKAMRIILVLVYVLLIILLLLGLLLNCRGCSLPHLPDGPDDVLNIGGNGDLKVTLQWEFYADIDLHVVEPSGEEIDYTHKHSRSGGELDVDDTSGGRGSAENIFWQSNPPRGQYQVSLVYYAEKTSHPENERHGDCKVTILLKDHQPQVFNIHMSPNNLRQAVPVTTITVP
ncbi:MAG: hypothetical protein IJ544_01010 [Prevotella sp.]|nr:hypothetical protein [Prevotella sp.]